MTNIPDVSQLDLFSETFKHAPIGMAIVSLEGRWLHVNASLCQILGYSEAEFLNMNFQGITHPDDLDKGVDVLIQFLKGNLESYQMEKRYIHRNGGSVCVSLTISIMRTEAKKPLFFIAQIKDLTESLLAEQDLKAKTEQLESFIKHNADAMWIIDAEDRVIEVNPAFETLFGWSTEEVRGKKLPIIPRFLRGAMDEMHEEIKDGKTVVGLETIRQHKDGYLLDVEATLSPLRDRSGKIIGITGICRDVTAKKRAEQELQAKTEQLQSFIENNADAIWLIDADDTILEVNPAFETLFGWSADEVEGKKLPMIPPSLKDYMHEIHLRIKKGETIVGFETVRQRKDGLLLNVEATLSPLRDRKGNIMGITGICRDVTAKKRAEQDLKAKTIQLESFIKNNVDPILIFDKHFIVHQANEACEEVLGWPKGGLIGMEWHRLPFIPAKSAEEIRHTGYQVANGQSVTGIETVLQRKDGEFINVVLTASPILDGNEKQSGWSATLRDITEWKIAQEHLQNTGKLSIAGQLAAGIAHEIRNPITSIKGFIQLMKSGVREKQQYFEIMSSEIDRIELILSELLILAKPQSVKYEKRDARVLLGQVMALLESQATLNNVLFEVEYKPEETYLYCDENQIKQVFINFIKNSIEAMPDGGKITIVIDSNSNQELLICFTDQGCGISNEVLSKLGQPFYTTKEKGTGLGFMVSKRIIESHSGNIHVESELNVGTRIQITLPAYNE